MAIGSRYWVAEPIDLHNRPPCPSNANELVEHTRTIEEQGASEPAIFWLVEPEDVGMAFGRGKEHRRIGEESSGKGLAYSFPL